MPDNPTSPTSTTSTGESTGQSTGGNTGTLINLEQLAAAVAAIAGSVQTLTSQMAASSQASQQMQTQIADSLKSLESNLNATNADLKSITENVNKFQASVTGETDAGYSIRALSATDPADDQHRQMAARDQVGANVQQMMSNMVQNCNALMLEYIKYTAAEWTRSVDHFSALPPIYPAIPPKAA